MKKHLTRFYTGLLILFIICAILGGMYAICLVLLSFPVVSTWIGIAMVVGISYMIGTSMDEMSSGIEP